MQIIPTIHIKGGKCFSTASSGTQTRHNIYTSSPVKLAAIWESKGASMIHVVDLDGAAIGEPANFETVKAIIKAVSIPIQCGGGVRSIKDIDEYLNVGAARVVCGTQPIRSHRFAREAVDLFGADRFVIGVDTYNGMIAVEGREKVYDYNPLTLMLKLSQMGVRHMIYTDLSPSAGFLGQRIENLREMIERTSINIMAGGGISQVGDIEKLVRVGAGAAIIGRSLYEGTLSLDELIERFEK